MKYAYAAILTECDGYIAVDIPDLSINTQGTDITDAIAMARDAIGMWACYELDEGRTIPTPSPLKEHKAPNGADVALVDIDISAYRRAHERRTVRKNVTLPSWLADMSENADISFSQVLQEALKEKLGVSDI